VLLVGGVSELSVSTGLEGVGFESVGLGVDVVVLGHHVGEGHPDSEHGHEDLDHHLFVWDSSSSQEDEVLRDIVGHLWGGGLGSVVVLNHTVMELRRHGDNHVIVVWVEVSSLWHINTLGWVVVVSSQQVVWVVDDTWRVSGGLGKFWWPDSKVGILGLMDSHVWWPDSIMNDSLSIVPLLEVISSLLLVTWMDLWQVNHLTHQFSLDESLVNQKIVLLMHSSVASLASSLENLESSSQSGRVEGVPVDLAGPVGVAVVPSDGVDLFFVTLDSVWSSDVVSE